MEFRKDSVRLLDVVADTNAGWINPDPIGQRATVQSGQKKAQGILDSILGGYSIGTITVRDISTDPKNQKIYPGVKWLVVDGGHRIRAIRDFQASRLATLDKKTYRTMSDEEREQFENVCLSFDVYTCTDEEATQIFCRLNKATPVSDIEMIMANDISPITKEIRSRVKSYKEYGNNNIHDLFAITTKADGTQKPTHWPTDINPGGKWFEYVGVVILKVLGKGNIDAGLPVLSEAVKKDQPIPSEVYKKVDQMLTDALRIASDKNKKLNGDIFAAFQAVWFALYENNKTFAIKDCEKFSRAFFTAHSTLTGYGAHRYDTEVRTFATGARNPSKIKTKTKTETVRLFVRRGITKFGNPAEQNEVAELYLHEMERCIPLSEFILTRDERRTVSKDRKFEMLAQQGFRCAIDGLPLDIHDAIFGHDTAWALGGTIEDGAIIRKEHNTNMGTVTLDEYRMILADRQKKAVVMK